MDFNRSIHIPDEVEEEQIEDNVTVEERLEHLNLDEELENDELENEEVENDDGSDYDDDDNYEDYDNNNDNDDDDDDDDDDDEHDEEEIDAYEGEEVDEVIPVSVSNSALPDSEGRNFKSDTDGLTCPICYEAWTDGGDHKVCCLPCGHLFGWSCIMKWLKNRRSHGKCPQCNKVCTLKDVRILYVNRVCVADEELHKRLRSLEAKCAHLEHKRLRSLEAKCADLEKKIVSLGGRGLTKSEFLEIMKEIRLETQTYHQERLSYFEADAQRMDATIYNQGVSRYHGDWMQHNQERYYAFMGFKCTPYQVPPPYHTPPSYQGPPGAPPIPVYDRDAALAQIQQTSDTSDKAGPSGFKSTPYQVPLRYRPGVAPGPVYDRDAALAEIQSRHRTAGPPHPSEPEPSHYPWEYFS